MARIINRGTVKIETDGAKPLSPSDDDGSIESIVDRIKRRRLVKTQDGKFKVAAEDPYGTEHPKAQSAERQSATTKASDLTKQLVLVDTGVDDSKKLSAKKREQLAEEIKNKALAYTVVEASEEEIDRIKREAEEFAEQDKKAKEEAETINKGDAIAFNNDKMIEENSDKISEDDKVKINEISEKLRNAVKDKNIDLINSLEKENQY